jgi:hypothetical protein
VRRVGVLTIIAERANLMEKELGELQKGVARIDERTEHILDVVEKQTVSLVAHEGRDREDFKEVHSRINRLGEELDTVKAKQNWMLGIGTAVAFAAGGTIMWLRSILGM